MSWKIPLFKIYYDKNDIDAVKESIKVGMHWAIGPAIQKFESMLSNYLGMKYSLVFNSGTSALHAALLAYDISEGNEVIVPSFTFIATANAPLFVGAKPIFADIEEETLGLDPEDVEKKITRRTKAIIAVHYGGLPCRIEKLREIAKKNNLILLEDAAESLGAKFNDKFIGIFGDASIFSFCQNKIITTGEGGAIVTNSKKIYEKLKLIRSHGRSESKDYFSSIGGENYITLGYNFRMSNINASLGIEQLKKIEKIIQMRICKSQYFTRQLANIPQIKPIFFSKKGRGVYQLYSVKVNPKIRNKLIKYLADRGIMSKVYFNPVHQTHFYKKILRYKIRLPVTEHISKSILSLPMFPHIKKTEINFIVAQLKNFFKTYRR